MKTSKMVREIKPVIILLGLPGSGKSTQARLLSRTYGFTCISPGNLLRRLITKADVQTRKQVESFMLKGAFISDELFFSLVLAPLKAIYDTSTGLVLDGVPRSLAQARELHSLFKESQTSKTIYLRISSDIMRERVARRLVCQDCQAPAGYPCSQLKCDFCQSDLVRRKDDTFEVMVNRWKEYLKQTEPLIQLYESRSALTHINGEQVIHIVFSDIINVLSSMLSP